MHTFTQPTRLLVLLAALAFSGAAAVPASAAIPGLEVVKTPSIDNSATKSATAYCPFGKRVIGAGADLDNGVGNVMIDDLIPNTTSVTVKAYEDDNGAPTVWRVNAYAICAYPLPGLEIVKTPSIDNSATKSATAYCPFGKRVIGAGADLDNGVGNVMIDDLIPNTTSVTVKAYEDDNGAPTVWRVNAYAICAYPLPGLEIVKTPSIDNSATKSATAYCPFGKRVIGAGADLDNGVGNVMIDDLIPNTTSVTVKAYEDDNGAPTVWRVNAYAICAAA